MKTKLKKWFRKWIVLIAFVWCVGWSLFAGIYGHWTDCLVVMMFSFLWFMLWAQSRINDKLAQHNAELMKWNDNLSKQCDDIDKDRAIRRIISYFYLYKYLNAQNDVDFCKRKINCTDYLSKKRWFEFMIETYTGILKERGQNV